MPKNLSRRLGTAFPLVLAFVLCSLVAWAGSLNFVYERAVYDSYGNAIGYQTQRLNSWEDLPVGNPWRTYLTRLVGTRPMFSYCQDVAKYLNAPLNFTISDRVGTSSSGKGSDGYSIQLYKHVTQYSTDASQKFVFLHELGHVAMLNSYPASYNFRGLDYGTDNAHYMDEILPNTNTAWVEGWANAFAALKNDSKVFSLSLADDSIVAFLKGNTFEEMGRNELFVGKVLYDVMNTFPSGKDKLFDVIARCGPHYSVKEFCQSYLRAYPGDQMALAKLLDKNGHGKASLREMLDYVNGGSNSVSKEFYAYLNSTGRLSGSSSSTASTNTTKKSWWDSFRNFFAGLFGSRSAQSTSVVAAEPAPDNPVRLTVGMAASEPANDSGVPYGQILMTPADNTSQTLGAMDDLAPTTSAPQDLATAQEEYYRAFAAYNEACAKYATDSSEVKKARERLQQSKTRLGQLKSLLAR
jgi:hypothetical protein